MDYNNATVTIGKVKSYNECVGDIVAKEGIFMFTKEDIVEEESIVINDMVIFRGEEVQGQKKAFFIRKLNPSKNIDDQVYAKTKTIKFLKEND